jgi:hypothetical protein
MRKYLCCFSFLIAAALAAGCAHQNERLLAPKPECTATIDFDKPDHADGKLFCIEDNSTEIFEMWPDEPAFPTGAHCTVPMNSLATETVYGDYDCGKAGKGNITFIFQRSGEGRGILIHYAGKPLSFRATWQ